MITGLDMGFVMACLVRDLIANKAEKDGTYFPTWFRLQNELNSKRILSYI
jgi:hypothetical protein